MKKFALFFLVFVLGVLCVIGIGAQEGQKVDKYAESVKEAQKLLDEQLPIVDFNAPKPTEHLEKLKRQQKDKRHNLGKPSIAEGMTDRTRVWHWPVDFPALPVEQSSAIIIGRVSEAKAHLSDDRSNVYSEVRIKVDQILNGNIGAAKTVIAERGGGRVRLPSGSIFRYSEMGRGIPKVDHYYLLFLKQLEDGDFSIVTGYELVNGRVVPLDEAAVVPFAKYKDSDEASFLAEVRASIKHGALGLGIKP